MVLVGVASKGRTQRPSRPRGQTEEAMEETESAKPKSRSEGGRSRDRPKGCETWTGSSKVVGGATL